MFLHDPSNNLSLMNKNRSQSENEYTSLNGSHNSSNSMYIISHSVVNMIYCWLIKHPVINISWICRTRSRSNANLKYKKKRDENHGGLGLPTFERPWKSCRVRYGETTFCSG